MRDAMAGTTSNTSDLLMMETTTMAGETRAMYPLWAVALISVILILVILSTIVGNVLVVLAICVVRKLRAPYNYLLVSLAVADLCVAIMVMPFALIYEIKGEWVLSNNMCDVWTSSDVLLCTASILNLCMISVDRYFAITRPLKYACKRTPKRMLIIILIVWFSSALISIPPLFGWKEPQPPGMCQVSQNLWYQLYATVCAFYLPCTIMIVLYLKIFLAAKRISDEEAKSYRSMTMYRPPAENPNGDLNQLDNETGSKLCRGALSKFRDKMSIKSHHHRRGSDSHFHRETKAAKTLGVIMGTFVLCWLPFFVTALVLPLCKYYNNKACLDRVPPGVMSLFLWLGYGNSMLNPIIYATLNREFRKPFQDLLCFRCNTMQERLRKELYTDRFGPSDTFVTQQKKSSMISSQTNLKGDSKSETTLIQIQDHSAPHRVLLATPNAQTHV